MSAVQSLKTPSNTPFGRRVAGCHVKTGDVIETWWDSECSQVIALKEITGRLSSLYPAGGRIASFKGTDIETVVGNDDIINIVREATVKNALLFNDSCCLQSQP